MHHLMQLQLLFHVELETTELLSAFLHLFLVLAGLFVVA